MLSAIDLQSRRLRMKLLLYYVKPCKLYTLTYCTNSLALYCRAIMMLPAIKHHLSSPQIRMGQGYMPKVCLSGMHGI